MAGHDQDRLADLNDAFRDPGVRAVITTRGGAGAYRIADDVDFAAVRADPKPLVGFSDITHLHLALWQHCRVPSVYGCLAGSHAATVQHLLMETGPVVLGRDRNAITASAETPGHATGPLVGGSLAALAGYLGGGVFSLAGAILVVEAHRTVGLGQVDRQLTQLIRSGALRGLAGVALGRFTRDSKCRCSAVWTLAMDPTHSRCPRAHAPNSTRTPAR